MEKIAIEDIGAGRFRVEGQLNFATVTRALETSRGLFAKEQAIRLDLSGVTATDSAGLALLVEWVIRARQGKCQLTYSHVPQQILAIARISDVDTMLPIAE